MPNGIPFFVVRRIDGGKPKYRHIFQTAYFKILTRRMMTGLTGTF